MTDFERERAWWDAKALIEELDRDDEWVNRALRWREIERWLDGVETILDVGGATGAFSTPLAQKGFRVTHLDISASMLAFARQKAEDEGVAIEFHQGNAVDLSRFGDRSFDLVLNLDGAISFCGIEWKRALLESCRVAKGRLIASVSNRGRLGAIWLESCLQVFGQILPAAEEMLRFGRWDQAQYPENAKLAEGATNDYLGVLTAPTHAELKSLVESVGLSVERLGGLGSLAGMIAPQYLGLIKDAGEPSVERFLDLCELYDREISPSGPGTRQRAGTIVVGSRR